MAAVFEPIADVLDVLRDLRSDNIRTTLSRVDDRPIVHTPMQVVFGYRMPTAIQRSILETVVTHATHAERRGPGAFDRVIELLLERFSTQSGSATQGSVHAQSSRLADVDSVVSEHARRGGRFVPAMVLEALRLAGFGGRIMVEKTSSVVPSVELVRGYTFDLTQLLPTNVSLVRPRIVCIDGFVESVSEVHHLLEAASESKEPCVVFTRGFSDDVIHTLKVNYDRGSLRVVPVKVPFDLDGMNTLVDLSTVSGADMVSSLKGDLISSVRLHDSPYVDQVTVVNGKTVVINTRTKGRVTSHVAQLRARRADVEVDDVGRLLDKRIKSLSPNHVVLRLPDDRSFVVNSQAVDHALRAVRSAIDHGVTAQGALVVTELAARVYSDRCYRTLMGLGASVG